MTTFKAPTSAVEICNLALLQLKQDFIAQLDPPSTITEHICAATYHQARRAALRKHPWNFALKRAQLLPSSDSTPAFGYTHAYNLPSDYVRKVYLEDSDGVEIGQEKYEIENSQVLYNGEDNTAINLVYVYDHTTVAKFDPLFIQALSLLLASMIAPKFMGTETRQQAILKMLEDAFPDAKAVDGQERPPKRRQTSRWLDRRRNYPTRLADGYTRFS